MQTTNESLLLPILERIETALARLQTQPQPNASAVMLTLREASMEWGVSPWTLRRLVKLYERTAGKEGLRAVMLGGAYRLTLADWSAYLVSLAPQEAERVTGKSRHLAGAAIDPSLWGG